MSLNGELWIIRNGRCTSEISVFNYPEHLNPFYEEDNHKRLRFWKLHPNNEGRRNSFSLDGLRSIWGFKSLRLKKKSSTLGINKTSESPPEIRRNTNNVLSISNDFLNVSSRQIRYSSPQEVNKSASNFERNEIIRSTLTQIHRSKNVEKNGTVFDRNNKYRSTLQIGEKPFSYSSDNNNDIITPHMIRGSSQSSVLSTNPFEFEEEDKITTQKVKRKKKKAPAPPVVVVNKPDSELKRSNESAPSISKCEKNSSNPNNFEEVNNVSIANLTAEIVEFVMNSKSSNHSTNELSQATLENTVNNDIIKNDQKNSQTAIERNATNDITNINQNKTYFDEIENGQMQFIHVNKDIYPDTRKKMLSFQPDETKHLKINGKTKFTLIKGQDTSCTNNPDNYINYNSNEKCLQELNPKKELIQPFISETEQKHVNTDEYSRETLEEIKSKTSAEITLKMIINNENNAPCTSVQKVHLSPEQLKIVESTENILESFNSSSITNQLPQSLETENFFHKTNTSPTNWKKSSLAPLQSNIPPEKRRTVQEIIESINKSQRLLCVSNTQSSSIYSTSHELEKFKMAEVENHKEDQTFDSQKIINNEIIHKDRFKKDDCPYRESSPTISNLDWNPLPKPKRSKNLSDF